MHAIVTGIAADVFRLSTFAPDYGIQFNQFLVLGVNIALGREPMQRCSDFDGNHDGSL